MYNSILVGMVVKVARFTGSQYNNSFLAKCVRGLSNIFNYLAKGSTTMGILTKSRSNIETSLVYSLYESVINFINIISTWIRQIINRGKDTSFSYSLIFNSFKDINSFIRTISLFVLSIGLGIIGVGTLNAENITVSIIVGLLIVLISSVILINSSNAKHIISNSLFFRAINDVFSIDEGGNQWW